MEESEKHKNPQNFKVVSYFRVHFTEGHRFQRSVSRYWISVYKYRHTNCHIYLRV